MGIIVGWQATKNAMLRTQGSKWVISWFKIGTIKTYRQIRGGCNFLRAAKGGDSFEKLGPNFPTLLIKTAPLTERTCFQRSCFLHGTDHHIMNKMNMNDHVPHIVHLFTSHSLFHVPIFGKSIA